MGLTKAKTNVIVRISTAIGVTIPGKGKKNLMSPKLSKQKTKLMKKRTTVTNNNADMNFSVLGMKQYFC